MRGFRVTGNFLSVRMGKQLFCIEVAAEDEIKAKEYVFCVIGSRHKIKRWQITLSDVKALAVDEITDHVVKYKIGA
ncbi:MAG: 50S ribosomal protein L18a [archaeon]|nr:50S ribosomal protein L18a [archaeon]